MIVLMNVLVQPVSAILIYVLFWFVFNNLRQKSNLFSISVSSKSDSFFARQQAQKMPYLSNSIRNALKINARHQNKVANNK